MVMITAESGVRLHVIDRGSQEGPVVVLLHGFPEFWWGWRSQINPLVDAGYRVLVPDQRGYNLSDKPKGLDPYRLDCLTQDVVHLVESTGRNKAVLIGHDWGGVVAWATAVLHPQLVDRLVVLNAPYPRLAIKDIARRPFQLIRSTYIYFFQLPKLPEWILSRHNGRVLADSLCRSSRLGTFSDEDLDRYREAWSQPGAITSMVNWYRALARRPFRIPKSPTIHPPTLILWGVNDAALGMHLAEASLRLCEDGQLIFHTDATHWIQHEEPDWINQHILQFLQTTDH